MKQKFILVIIPLLFFVSQRANSQIYNYDHSMEFSVNGNYLFSNANYNGAGAVYDLNSGNQMNDFHSMFKGRFLLNNNWAFSAGLGVAYIMTKGSDAQRTNSGLSEYYLGTDMKFSYSWAEVIPTLSLTYPAEKIDESSDTAINSDGSMRIDLLLNLQTKMGRTNLFGNFGYAYRDQGRSSLLPWSAGILWDLKGSEIGGRIFGFQSITDDKDTGADYNRLSLINRVSAGSYLYYSVNPSVIDSEVLYNYYMNNDSKFLFTAGLTLLGNNYAQNYHLSVALQFNFGELDSSSTRRRNKYNDVTPVEAISSEKKVNSFKEDTSDGVDQNLFKVPNQEASKPSKEPVDSEQDLKSQLDSVEMSIELKSTKKKKKKKKKSSSSN